MSGRLKVGLATLHGTGDAADYAKGAKSLVTTALDSVEWRLFPARVAFLFATGSWCRTSNPLPAAVRYEFKERLGYDVPLIGGSMALIYCSSDPDNPVVEDGVVLVTICSPHFFATVSSMRRPHNEAAITRQQKLRYLAGSMEQEANVRIGASAERFLVGFMPGIITDADGSRSYADAELHQEILEAFGCRYQFIGGSAADGFMPNRGFQFANDEWTGWSTAKTADTMCRCWTESRPPPFSRNSRGGASSPLNGPSLVFHAARITA
ncbi:MAG: hypothetical protein NTZ09_08280 [Candidatus Hydrogenedentes bacterium]|nr:hypothetical protein [Candidatus Hydrogenedentota bacterium]